jgi:hypothetical protein
MLFFSSFFFDIKLVSLFSFVAPTTAAAGYISGMPISLHCWRMSSGQMLA